MPIACSEAPRFRLRRTTVTCRVPLRPDRGRGRRAGPARLLAASARGLLGQRHARGYRLRQCHGLELLEPQDDDDEADELTDEQAAEQRCADAYEAMEARLGLRLSNARKR
jgi:hypothetical protein